MGLAFGCAREADDAPPEELRETAAAIGPANLALNKPTTQSSTDFGAEASRAVDGNTDGNWNGASVTHTLNEHQPRRPFAVMAPYTYNGVELGGVYSVSSSYGQVHRARADSAWTTEVATYADHALVPGSLIPYSYFGTPATIGVTTEQIVSRPKKSQSMET